MNTYNISFYKSLTNTKGVEKNINDVLNDIRNGTYKKLINDIRGLSKTEYDEKKKLLPAFTPSGLFTERKASGLIRMSGLICLDFDKLENVIDTKEAICLDNFVFAAFISPSGNGLKVLIKIEAEKHKESFLALSDYYKSSFQIEVDKQCKDISRLCFVSDDDKLFWDENAEIFKATIIVKEEKNNIQQLVKKNEHDLIIDVENVVLQIEEKRIDITNTYEDWRNLGFALADGLNETGRTYFHRISVFNPDYSHEKCEIQYSECLKGRSAGIKVNTFFHIAKTNGISIQAIKKSNEVSEIKFWNAIYKTNADGTKQFKGIEIDRLSFTKLLYSFGFRRFDVQGINGGFYFVNVKNNIVSETSIQKIQDSFFKHVKSLPEKIEKNVMRDDINRKALHQIESLFGKSLLSTLNNENDFVFNKDSKNESFIYYKNGFVKCTSGNYSFHPYTQLQKTIWKERIIDRNFEATSKESWKNATGNFEKFIINVCGKDKDRIVSLMSIIGYLLHDFNETKMKAVIMTDSKISEENEGRTGKTLFGKALKKIRNVCELPGKDFKPDDRFKYQGAQLSTQIMFLNDARSHFNIESLYNDITEGITIEKKNQAPVSLKVKYLITTNRTIKTKGASSKDRVVEFEFSDYYSDKFSPQTEFNQWFFTEWDKSEWVLFDNFMMNCISLYLEQGIFEVTPVNLEKRKLIDQTSKQFYDFIISGEVKPHEEFCLQYVSQTFEEKYPDYDFRTSYPARKISQWLKVLPQYEKNFYGTQFKRTKKSNNQNYYIFSS